MNPKGRPPKPPGTTKTEVFTVRCTKTEKERYNELKQQLAKELNSKLA